MALYILVSIQQSSHLDMGLNRASEAIDDDSNGAEDNPRSDGDGWTDVNHGGV